MKYVEKNLRGSEHIVAKAKVSWTVMALEIIRAVILMLIGLAFWSGLNDPLYRGSEQTFSLDLTGFSSAPGTVAVTPTVETGLIIHYPGEELIRPTAVPEPGYPVQIPPVQGPVNITLKMPDPTAFLIVWTVLVVIRVIYKALSISAVELAVTDRKIVGKTGIIRSVSVDAFLEKIDYFMIRESLLGRVFNYAVIEIGTTSSKIRFPYIEYASYFRNAVMDCIDRRKYNDMVSQAKLIGDGEKDKDKDKDKESSVPRWP